MSENEKKLLYIAFAFGAASLIFSIVGHLEGIEGGLSLRVILAALFQSSAHVVLDGLLRVEESGSASIYLIIGQGLAIAFAATGLYAILKTLSNDFNIIRFKRRMKRGNIDLIIGMGWHGKELVRNIDPINMSTTTLAVSLDIDDATLGLCKKTGVLWRSIDVDSDRFFEIIDVAKIKRIYISTGSDDKNIQLIAKFKKIVDRLSIHGDIEFFVSSGQSIMPTTWSFVSATADGAEKVINVNFYSDYALTAKLLMQNRDEAWNFPKTIKISHLILIGSGKMHEALLHEWLQSQVLDVPVEIDLVVENPDYCSNYVVDKFGCFNVCKESSKSGEYYLIKPIDDVWVINNVLPVIRIHRIPESNGGRCYLVESKMNLNVRRRTIVAVVDDRPDVSITMAKSMLPAVEYYNKDKPAELKVSSWVYLNVSDESVGQNYKDMIDFSSVPIFYFNDMLGNCSKDTIANDAIERSAWYVNYIYTIHKQLGDKIEADGLKSLESLLNYDANISVIRERWRVRKLWDRESSRACALHSLIKKGIATRLNLESSLAMLAKFEHNRWCAFHLLRGWRPILSLVDPFSEVESGLVKQWYEGKDNFRQRFLHICLMPYEKLSEFDDFYENVPGKKHEVNKDVVIAAATDHIHKVCKKIS